MNNRKIGVINLETGEILDQSGLVAFPPKFPVGERFFMGFQDAFISIAEDREIKAQPSRVLYFLMGNLDFENFIQIPQVEICQRLGMKKQDVSKAIKILFEKKVLLVGPKIGRSLSYRLNPYYGWKGKVSNLKKAKKNHLDLAVDNTQKEK